VMWGDEDGFLPVDECARRLGISEQRVAVLVEQHVLKAKYDGWMLVVQPALVEGVTTTAKTRVYDKRKKK
jgi:hypothetical protein